MTSKEKIAALRKSMQRDQIDAFIVYSADPHMSEYFTDEWKERAWLSGFTGSAGFVVITLEKAGLWTDGRYFTQAAIELEGSGIDLFKQGMPETPHYIDWIISEIPVGGKVAVNALATSHSEWIALTAKLDDHGMKLLDLPLLENIWIQRGVPPKNPIYIHPLERAGCSVEEKIADIREKMKIQNADVHIISSLDDVAWTLNLRGSDVECNPVFLAYIILSQTEVMLFTDLDKLNEEARKQMGDAGVKLLSYEGFFESLKEIKQQNILISPHSNQAIFERLKKDNRFIEAPVPGNLMKAQKNETELEGFRKVMLRDGIAMVKFLYWLTHRVGKEAMNEYSIGEKLRSFRAEGQNFVGESFSSIIGYQENGAIIHYSAKKDSCKSVIPEGSILIDSGGQYLEGTTDITRTWALGAISEAFKRDATLVLQGMIRLSMLKFPRGTRGVQLDAFARQPLWQEGKDYNHGTGHGVGSFMNVHEGPQNFRKDLNPQELLPGMVLSNEPGYYIEQQYGIRHENLIVVKEIETTQWNSFYVFETLTLCPFLKDIIVKEMLSAEELQWLNAYHKTCEKKLAPHLEAPVKDWFLKLVSPL
ncbi:M24 family metallopeptidase [Elizabethkingia argentiflava]|uniref:M24 family metallopeptidase n=1 Tax=Elizabethkingia argenteiflava TaxID=2681556 RepID=A0A845PR44_9FLAO|nr:aminopeptidase P family protein [Elizabethkingia argenteiflava]NAW50115.1 M24 family metallopeptidase [Elizabethkingia argenteiflava]